MAGGPHKEGRGTLEDGRGGGTGDTNPGCNYLVRGYSPSMHFFWRGDMPHYFPPLPYRRGRVGCPYMVARGQPAPAPSAGVAVVHAGGRAAAEHRAGVVNVLLASLCSPFSGVFPFLDRYISLAQNIRYVIIKPMTKCCPVFMLSLAGVQQDRNSILARNYGAAIREKSFLHFQTTFK